MATEHHRKNHCKYMIKLHMIFVVKYRKPLLINSLGEDIKQIMFDISKKDYSKFSRYDAHRIWELRKDELKKDFWKEQTFCLFNRRCVY